MKLPISYKHLAAEFVIVVVGVAVALAADSWRQGIQEQSLINSYFERLKNDLMIGKDQLETVSADLESIEKATGFLLGVKEAEKAGLDEDILVENINLASRAGFVRAEFNHDTTYTELIETGRLALISNQDLLLGLAEYYRLVQEIGALRETMPRDTIDVYLDTVGRPPSRRFLPLSDTEKQGLLDIYRNDPAYTVALKRVQARAILVTTSQRFPNAFEYNERLMGLLN